MQNSRFGPSLAALRRKLQAVAALARDAGATPPERANAARLKQQIEQRLRDAGVPADDWTDHAFRLGRRLKAVQNSASLAPGTSDWTGQARRLGKAVGRLYRKRFSD